MFFSHLAWWQRLLLIFLLTIVLIFLTPYFGEDLEALLYTHTVNIGIIYAIIIGFFMSLSLTRRSALDEYISLELNKIRRLHHLAKHLAELNPKLRPWFNQIKETIAEYHASFGHIAFNRYEEGNKLFRQITYTIYQLPKQKKVYNPELFSSLLDTAASVTEAREYIRAKIKRSIRPYQWAVLTSVTLSFSFLIATATPFQPINRLTSFIVIFNILLALELLYRYDAMSKENQAKRSRLYVDNQRSLG